MTATTEMTVASNQATAPLSVTIDRAIAAFERSILSHMRDATKPWLAIAQEFLAANKELKKPAFKQLCEKVRLSYSTARKLIKIAESQRLLNYADRLACIDSWSTLHEIAKLDSSSFDNFATEYLQSNDVRAFMRSDVELFNSKNAKTSVRFESYFTVQVSASSALSTSDEQFLATTAKSIEETLAGKVKIKWHLNQPTITSPSSMSVMQ